MEKKAFFGYPGAMTDFVHLHVHSDYSLLDGAAAIHRLAEKARFYGMKHLALTDHGNMFGALKFLDACLGDKDHPVEPIHPIIGSEFYMAPGSRHQKSGAEYKNKYFHLILLAACEEGYRNLMMLSSRSFTEGFYYKPRIDEELLTQYHRGLICLSACLAGEIPSLILEDRLEAAEKRALWFRDLLGDDNFYLELQDHGIPEQRRVNGGLVNIARRTGIPLVATNDVHYVDQDDAAAHDIPLCMGPGKTRRDEPRLRYQGDQFYFKNGDEMARLFADYPEALINTVRIAERCRTEIPAPGPLLPDFGLPPGFADTDGYLRHLTMEGLAKRYPGRLEEVRERGEYELGVIIKMGFTGYFLIVADFINWAKEHNISVGPGRGSGAGSIVAYALRITDLDPLKYQLLFERFLNPERISMPDFDVDFCNERRGEVIRYVTEKYGQERVGQICTFAVLKAKAVIKDVARVLDISLDESNMIAKLIPEDPKMTLKRAFEEESRLRELEETPRYQELFAIARKLEGLNRHSSFHAAGIVIGKTSLTDYVPLYRDQKTGVVASQYTMDAIEKRGLVKMDFLGLKTLDIIQRCEELVRLREDHRDFSIAGIPESDSDSRAAAAYRMLGEGRSYGVFQFESEGMQKILRDARPSSVEDLIALNALYRPGPIDNIPKFINSKWGREQIRYPHPDLETILKETYGVIVYQEQVMQVAQIIGGYSLGQADLLRRAMSKKKMEEMVREKEKFLAGAVSRGYDKKLADDIFELLIPFAGYGFNKSHAAAYAVLAYQTAYLKANFPVEFMAANMSNEISSVDKLPLYIEEARSMGISIDPPSVNHSSKYFTVVEGRIVYGLLGIKGVGHGPAEEIIRSREEEGAFRDFMDFLDRVNLKMMAMEKGSKLMESRIVGKKVIELLIKTGAFDAFGQTRATLLENLEAAFEYAQSKKEDRKFGQASLFEDTGEKEYPDFEFRILSEMDRMTRLQYEQELLGFYFSGHPMDDCREAWEELVTMDISAPLPEDKKTYTLIGMLTGLNKPFVNRKNEEMCYGTLQDYRGSVSLKFFPEVWAAHREELREIQSREGIIAVKGKVDTWKKEGQDRPAFVVNELPELEDLKRAARRSAAKRKDAAASRKDGEAASRRDGESRIAPPPGPPAPRQSRRELHIRLEKEAAENEGNLVVLRDYLLGNPGPCSVFIHVPVVEGEVLVRTASQIGANPSCLESLAHQGGVARAWCEEES
jgi:DNA polymerase-3 subunit alpha